MQLQEHTPCCSFSRHPHDERACTHAAFEQMPAHGCGEWVQFDWCRKSAPRMHATTMAFEACPPFFVTHVPQRKAVRNNGAASLMNRRSGGNASWPLALVAAGTRLVHPRRSTDQHGRLTVATNSHLIPQLSRHADLLSADTGEHRPAAIMFSFTTRSWRRHTPAPCVRAETISRFGKV